MSVLMHWSEDGYIRRLPAGHDKADCQHATILFLAGTGITDAGGRWSLEVHDSLCVKLGEVTWVSMVATPSERLTDQTHPRPSSVTTQWLQNAPDLTLFVQSWDCRCEPLPEVEFGYHVAIGRIVADKAA